jgi:hypothetical protein
MEISLIEIRLMWTGKEFENKLKIRPGFSTPHAKLPKYTWSCL